MLFLPNDDELAAQSKQIVEDVVKAEGRCSVVGWRDVPVDHSVVGRMAKATEPRIVNVSACLAAENSSCSNSIAQLEGDCCEIWFHSHTLMTALPA